MHTKAKTLMGMAALGLIFSSSVTFAFETSGSGDARANVGGYYYQGRHHPGPARRNFSGKINTSTAANAGVSKDSSAGGNLDSSGKFSTNSGLNADVSGGADVNYGAGK